MIHKTDVKIDPKRGVSTQGARWAATRLKLPNTTVFLVGATTYKDPTPFSRYIFVSNQVREFALLSRMFL